MMRQHSQLFRLSTSVALGALLCNVTLPVAATAQPAPAPPPVAQPDQNQGDPPSRVGRIAGLSGTVSFRTAGDTQWSLASTNYPVASGNAFWTEPSAEANLEVSASRLALAPQTEFDVNTLDPSGLQGVAAQGEIYLHLNDLAPDEVWSVQTPRGQVHLARGGRYGIVVGTTDQPTTVTVLDGAAQIEGPGVSLQIAANETATIDGSDPFQGSVGPAVRDAFLNARLNAERPPPRPAIAAPVAARVYAMPGGEDLVSSGSWSQAPQYGQVWYPPVSQGWVPYRQGHWAYVAPWGWTWVDNAPWGFAPFHYGRWVQIGDRWGWTPGEVVAAGPPVYAPALVTFLGIGAGVAVGIGIGAALAGGSVGWVPLGPGEAYHPWYHASDNYVRQVNVTHISNVSNVSNVTTINNYINRGAATSVPAAVMTGSRPVQTAAQPITPQQFAAARPVYGQQPIRPTATTAGVTPAVARQLNLAPAGVAPPHVAPGPVVRAQAAGPAASGAEHTPVRPPLIGPHGEQPSAPHPAAAAVPGATATPAAPHEPGHPPALVSPGARPPGLPASPAAPHPGQAASPGAVGTAGAPAEPGHMPAVVTPSARANNGPVDPGVRPPGTPPAVTPPVHSEAVGHPAAVPAPANRPPAGEHPAAPPQPRVERPAVVPHPSVPAPEVHAASPPRAAPPAAEHAEATQPPPPHVEAARPPPPHVEAARPTPPHMEAARPPPPHVEAAQAAPQVHPAPAEHQKKPGEP